MPNHVVKKGSKERKRKLESLLVFESQNSQYQLIQRRTWESFFFFKILFIFRESGRDREREGEKHQSVASHTTPIGDLVHNPGMCPD